MSKRICVSGVLGMAILVAWSFVVNGVLGFNSRINLRQIPDERRVYETLKGSVVEPGRYIFNPELTPSGMFPDGEPVFSVHYSGMGHESAGKVMLLQLAVFLVAPTIAAWMLSLAAPRILRSYPRKVTFFVAIGLLLALVDALMDFGIDRYAIKDALLMAADNILAWTLVGLVVAKVLRPGPDLATPSRVRERAEGNT